MLMKVFAILVIILYFVFVSASITVIVYPWLKQGISHSFSYAVRILQITGQYSHKEINI
jgi:hypothetical protein